MPKGNEHHKDRSTVSSGHGDTSHKDGSYKGGGALHGRDGAVRDKYQHESSSEKEYRKHGWNVEYANESEEGYSKKA